MRVFIICFNIRVQIKDFASQIQNQFLVTHFSLFKMTMHQRSIKSEDWSRNYQWYFAEKTSCEHQNAKHFDLHWVHLLMFSIFSLFRRELLQYIHQASETLHWQFHVSLVQKFISIVHHQNCITVFFLHVQGPHYGYGIFKTNFVLCCHIWIPKPFDMVGLCILYGSDSLSFHVQNSWCLCFRMFPVWNKHKIITVYIRYLVCQHSPKILLKYCDKIVFQNTMLAHPLFWEQPNT